MTTIKSFFDNVFNLFRNNEHKTGEEVLKIITHFITYYKIQEHITDEDINDINEKLNMSDSEDLKNIKAKWMRFDELYNYLSRHKKKACEYYDAVVGFCLKNSRFSDAFRNFETDKIQYDSTITDIFDMLKDTDFESVNVDILGDMYEEIIKTQIGGQAKSLGQFFTPSTIRKEMIEMLDIEEGEKIYDFAMGSGGFLLSAYDYLKNKGVKDKNIMKSLGGCEIQDKVFSLCCSNLLMISGSLPKNIKCGDSFLNPQYEKYDVVVANPPFGIKMNKTVIQMIDTNFIPYKSSNSVLNFIQVAISLLKVGGRCAIIIPSGQELSSTSKAYVNVRRYLFHTCKVISLKSSNAKFKTTGVDTSILYFVKKSSEERDKPYKSKVEFDNIKVKTKIIAQNNYSLSENIYHEEEIEEKEGYETYNLGDIITYLPKSKRKASEGKNEGKYNFYTSSNVIKKIDEYDYEEHCIILGDGGSATVHYDKKFSCSSHNHIIQARDEVLLKYLYYYLKSNIHLLQKQFQGTGIKNISKERLNNVKVQIPSLEIQEKIIEECDRISKQIKQYNDMLNGIDLNIKSYIIKTLKMNEYNITELGDIININFGKRITKTQSDKEIEENPDEETYPVYGGGDESFRCLNYNREGLTCKISRFGMSYHNCVMLIDDKYHLLDSGMTIESNTKKCKDKYLFYWLLSNKDKVYNCGIKSAQMNISIDLFKNIKIQLPDIKTQKKIIEFCDFQIQMKENLEQQIQYLNELIHI